MCYEHGSEISEIMTNKLTEQVGSWGSFTSN